MKCTSLLQMRGVKFGAFQWLLHGHKLLFPGREKKIKREQESAASPCPRGQSRASVHSLRTAGTVGQPNIRPQTLRTPGLSSPVSPPPATSSVILECQPQPLFRLAGAHWAGVPKSTGPGVSVAWAGRWPWWPQGAALPSPGLCPYLHSEEFMSPVSGCSEETSGGAWWQQA